MNFRLRKFEWCITKRYFYSQIKLLSFVRLINYWCTQRSKTNLFKLYFFSSENQQFRSRDALYRRTSVYIGLNQCNQRCIERRRCRCRPVAASHAAEGPLQIAHACTHLFICVRRRWRTNSLIRIYIHSFLMKTPTLAIHCTHICVRDQFGSKHGG